MGPHFRNVQGLTFNISDTCLIVRSGDHVDESDLSNFIIDFQDNSIYTKLTDINERCNMNKNVTSDALNLATNLRDSFLPGREWEIFNIVRTNQDINLPESLKDKDVFRYEHSNSKLFLKKYGVIEGETIGWWYVGISSRDSYWGRVMPVDLSIDDNIVEAAHKNGYLKGDMIVEYYYHVPTKNNGPRIQGHSAILVNRKALNYFCNKFAKDIDIQIPEGKDYIYQNRQLFFRLVDGGIDEFDFSKAKIARDVFETFYNLWIADGIGSYSVKDVVKKFRIMFKGEELSESRIGEIVSNIRASIINPKPTISDRIEWRYDRHDKKWIFKIFSLKH